MIRTILKKSIRTRIFLAIILPLALSEAVLFYFYRLHLTNDFILKYENIATTISVPFIRAVDKKLTQIEALEDRKGFLGVYADLKGSIDFYSWIKQHKSLLGVSFFDDSNLPLVGTPQVKSFKSIHDRNHTSVISYRNEHHILVSVPLVTEGVYLGALNFWFSDEEIAREETRSVLLSVVIFAFSVLMGGTLAFWISSAITKPLMALAFDSKRIASGELDHEIVSSNAIDEIGLLAANFQLMRDSIREKIAELEDRNTKLAREVVERKKTAAALTASEAKFRDLSELLPQVIFETDADNNIVYTNRQGIESFGYSRKDLKDGLNLVDIIFPDDLPAALQNIKKKISGETLSSSNEYRFIRKNGAIIPCLIYSAPIIKEGIVSGLRGILIDISERKTFEDQLHHSQKMEAIGTLAGGIAHDFNNLLMGIQGRSSLIKLTLNPSDSNVEHVEAIEAYIHSATNLTQQLLGTAQGGKYNPKATDLNSLLANSSKMFGRTRKEIKIQLHLSRLPVISEVDVKQIEQVLLNIFVNAAQAMPDGGELYLKTSVETVSESSHKHRQAPPGKYNMISATDTGIGMDETTRQQIFDPFFTTKDKGRGTGLGLASAYGILKNHDGFITVKSEVGHGTTFNIYLPVSTSQPSIDIQQEAATIKGSGTVLLVDDEQMIIDVGQAMLGELGYNVIVAASGEDAIESVKKGGEDIDLVILDLIMPTMDGGRTFDIIRDLRPSIPVILSSGYAIDGQAADIMQRGCEGFIQKPFTLSELSLKISEVVSVK